MGVSEAEIGLFNISTSASSLSSIISSDIISTGIKFGFAGELKNQGIWEATRKVPAEESDRSLVRYIGIGEKPQKGLGYFIENFQKEINVR